MVSVITYDVPHKKTQDVLLRLKAHGYTDVECVALPFIKRKRFTPLINHRPGSAMDINPRLFCERLGYTYTTDVDLSRYSKILIGGANILPKEFIGDYEIINSHPGYLPYVRGLDSLKWAIYKGLPVGVTTHVITDGIDEGLIIDQRIVDVGYFDTIHSLGQKTYDLEISMLVEAINISERTLPHDFMEYKNPANRRMPHRLEVEVMDKFR